MQISKAIKASNKTKQISRIIKAIEALDTTIGIEPEGIFGQRVIISSGKITLDSSNIDIEFTVPFDNDIEVNEAEISVYNLSDESIANLKYNQKITITAGYKDDTGIIFSGYISKTKTKYDNVDKVTTIYALDDQSLLDKEIQEISYAENIKSSYVLEDLLKRTGLPIAIFNPRHDYINKDPLKIDGSLNEAIKKFAKQCGVDVYILKSKIYAHDIRTASIDISFDINSNTGMIGIPEEFTEEVEDENYKEVITGYSIEMLLQHRLQTGVKIKLSSRNAKGIFSVQKGEHSYDGTNLITKIDVIS